MWISHTLCDPREKTADQILISPITIGWFLGRPETLATGDFCSKSVNEFLHHSHCIFSSWFSSNDVWSRTDRTCCSWSSPCRGWSSSSSCCTSWEGKPLRPLSGICWFQHLRQDLQLHMRRAPCTPRSAALPCTCPAPSRSCCSWGSHLPATQHHQPTSSCASRWWGSHRWGTGGTDPAGPTGGSGWMSGQDLQRRPPRNLTRVHRTRCQGHRRMVQELHRMAQEQNRMVQVLHKMERELSRREQVPSMRGRGLSMMVQEPHRMRMRRNENGSPHLSCKEYLSKPRHLFLRDGHWRKQRWQWRLLQV